MKEISRVVEAFREEHPDVDILPSIEIAPN